MPKPQPLDFWHILRTRNNAISRWLQTQEISSFSEFLRRKSQIEAEGEYFISQEMMDLVKAQLGDDTIAPEVPVTADDMSKRIIMAKRKPKKVSSNDSPAVVQLVQGTTDTQGELNNENKDSKS